MRAPVIDGAVVERVGLGIHGSLASARRSARSAQVRRLLDAEDRVYIPWVHVIERSLNFGPDGYRGQLWLSREGAELDRLRSDDEIGFWKGRAAEACRWQCGDLVATVHRGRYRVGIVLAPPHTPEWMKDQFRPGITRCDDVYLVGFTGRDHEHGHPRDAELFAPLAPVPAALRKRLKAREQARGARR